MIKERFVGCGRWLGLLLALAFGAMLAGCGGGGSNSNGLVNPGMTFSVTPSDIRTGPNTIWTLSIGGGVRPYRIRSSSPFVVVEKEQLRLDETSVTIRTLDPHGEATVPVAIYDAAGRLITASVTINSATVSPLQALPATLTAYHNSPALINASGGLPPYRIISSNPAIIANATWSQYGDFLIIPGNVGAEITVPLTLQDSSGQSAAVSVLVKPAPLLNVFTVTPVPAAPGVGCGSAVCSGQDATASVALKGFEGGPLSGRQVRFDVVQGEYLFYSGNAAQPLVSTTTVTSDQNGLALVRFKANVNAVTGAALIRATDLVTGNSVSGSFVIAQFTDGTGTLSIVPKEAIITTYYNDECSSGVPTSYYVFGGTPPYRVVTSFPDAVLFSGIPVQTNGGGFTTVTRGICVDPADVIVTDATGRTLTALLRNKPGTQQRPATPAPTPRLSITPAGPIGTSSAAGLTCGQTATFVVSGGTSASYVAASPSPGLIATISGGTLSVQVRATYALPAPTTNPASAMVNVSDGTNVESLEIWIPATCP